MYCILGNYGNESIAVLQWAIEQTISPLTFVSIDTGWAAKSWLFRVAEGEAYAQQAGVTTVRLHTPKTLPEVIQDRNEFPTKKYQWCPSLLKGSVWLHWLDEVDPACHATIILGKMRSLSPALTNLPERIEDSEFHGGRKVWHPLYRHSLVQRDQLIVNAGFAVLPHRSLECEPCIHARVSEITSMANADVDKTVQLERQLSRAFFPEWVEKGDTLDKQIQQLQQTSQASSERQSFDMGCGSPWSCGS